MFALEAVELVFSSMPGSPFCGDVFTEVDVRQLQPGDFIIFDVAEVTCNIESLLEGLGDSLSDVVHGGGPHMVQPLLKFSGVSL